MRTVTVDLGNGRWRATYVVSEAQGRVVIESLRLDPIGACPPGGITSKLLHSLRVAPVIRSLRPFWGSDASNAFWRDDDMRRFWERRVIRRPRAGRRARVTDERLFQAARAYDAALRAGDGAPDRTVAQQLGLKH